MEYRIIKYGATWCGQCKMQDKEFNRNPLKYPVNSVDIDELEDDELTSLNLTSIPVTILWIYDNDSSSWKEVHRWIGYTESKEINSFKTTEII